MRRLLEALVLPPASGLALVVLGLLVLRRRPRLGRALWIAGLAWTWLAATPVLGTLLLITLQTEPALPSTGPLPDAQAIVVVSAEADVEAPEYGQSVIGPMTMQRVRYAAWLQKRTGLPVLTSGGIPQRGAPPLADLMAQALEREFGVGVRWREGRSADTWQNATFSAELLRAAGVTRVLLVSNAFHLPRAASSFRAAGLEVVPAPTGFRTVQITGVRSFVPSWQGLRDTSLALHEWAGRLAYLGR